MAFSGTQQKCKACDKTVYVVDQLSADGVAYHRACFKCNHCKGTLKLSNFSSLDGVLYCKPHFEQLFKETGSYSKSFQSPAKTDDKSRPEGPELTGSPVPVEKPTPELTGSPSTVEKATPEQTGSPNTVEKATPEQMVSPRTVEKVTPELTKSPSRFQRSTPELTRSPSKAAGMFSGTQEKCVTCGKTAYPLEKKTLTELHGMLKTAESSIISEPKREILMVQSGRVAKNSGNKGKAKGKGKAVAAKPKPEKKAGPADSQCFYCGGKGHYKRDCPKFKEDSKNGNVTLNSGPPKKQKVGER